MGIEAAFPISQARVGLTHRDESFGLVNEVKGRVCGEGNSLPSSLKAHFLFSLHVR